eukprot:6172501-Pleurochrysis_carterae.AAC.2
MADRTPFNITHRRRTPSDGVKRGRGIAPFRPTAALSRVPLLYKANGAPPLRSIEIAHCCRWDCGPSRVMGGGRERASISIIIIGHCFRPRHGHLHAYRKAQRRTVLGRRAQESECSRAAGCAQNVNRRT